MDNYRNKTRKVQIGDVCIGGGEKIAIQSMTNTKTEDVEACVAQILRLEKAGCDIIRVAVPTMEAAESISKIKSRSIFHWWRIYILIIAWQLQQSKTERIRSVSIREISEMKKESEQW